MMNKTQKVIILTGEAAVTSKAIEVIKGFKAVSVVKQLNDAVVENVFRHNKNVVYATKNLRLTNIIKYRPIVINCINGKTDIEEFKLGSNNIMEDFPTMLDQKNVDVGDHEVFDSKGGKATKDNCFICKLAQGNPVREEHILYETENFLAVPGLGAFYDGYVMIVPKSHIMSFAELEEEKFEEMLQVINDIRFILESVYQKKIFVFECGSGKGGEGKHETSIVHAHIHFAPTDMDVLEEVHKSGLYPAQIEPKDLIKEYGEDPYMLYIDQEDNWYITSDPETYFPRQHPRQVLADYMGLKKGEYNWRIYPHEDRMKVIANEIYSFLREEFDNLPPWIQKATKKYI